MIKEIWCQKNEDTAWPAYIFYVCTYQQKFMYIQLHKGYFADYLGLVGIHKHNDSEYETS